VEAGEESRLAAARLLTALLGGDSEVLDALVDTLAEAEVTLRGLALMDCSAPVRAIAEKLLTCLTVPAP
jgi:hypothetical protein